MTVGIVTISWWIVALVVATLTGSFWWAPLCVVPWLYLSLLAHELGHAIAAGIYGAHGVGAVIRLPLKGRTLGVLTTPLTKTQAFLFHGAGPWAGLAVAGLALGIGVATHSTSVVWAGIACATMNVWNLLPWFRSTSDGAKILAALKGK